MKYIGLLVSSICVTLVILVNFYYNSITLDMQKIEDYISEINIISKDLVENTEETNRNKKEYIDRLTKIEKGMENSKTSFLVSDYKEYKIKSIKCLKKVIVKNDNVNIKEYNLYSKLSDKEFEKLINKKSPINRLIGNLFA